MVSRSNFFSIILIMIIILVMFQLTGVSEQLIMNTGDNLYSESGVTQTQIEDEKDSFQQITSSLEVEKGCNAEIGLVGDASKECINVGKNWAKSQKKEYCYYSDICEAAADTNGAALLIVSGSDLKTQEDAAALETLSQQGRHVVVSGIPDAVVQEKNKELGKCLGILQCRDSGIHIEGFKLFAGLLFGDETVYDEYDQNLPYVQLSDSVTVYAVAQSEENWFQELENEDLPPVIWRYAPDDGKVYVVNGTYLEGNMGAGLLTGFAADCQQTYIYPVVNAQITVLENYPVLSDENEDYMEREYGQKSSLVFRDILWPSIVAIFRDTKDSMTAVGSTRLDYTDDQEIDSSLLQYYFEQITKESGEMGISGYQVSDVPLSEKISKDLEVFEEVLPDYEIRTFLAGDLEEESYASLLGEGNLLEDVHTVLTDYSEKQDGMFQYLGDPALQLPIYMEASVLENEDDFRARCLMTAYGYYGTSVDMSRIIYPEDKSDVWNLISRDWSRFYRPYRVIFEAFDKMTSTEADRRVRNYLALDYDMERQEDTINLSVQSHEEESFFVLRLHGEEISSISGASYQELGDGWYLLSVSGDHAKIQVKQTAHAGYYIEKAS